MFCYVSFQDFYRVLLEAESDGILKEVDMIQVEKLILDPNRDKRYGVSYEDVATKLLNTEEINSYLMVAAREGEVDRVNELIAEGADVNNQDEQGETALMAAAKTGQTICLDQLLQSNAHPNITDNEGNTALIHAITGRKIECVKELIAKGANVNIGTATPLILSIRSRSFDITNELLKVNATDILKNSPLIEAVSCGKNTIVQSLLLKGAYVNAKNTDGDKAIHLAAERSHKEYKRQQTNIEQNKENGELTSLPKSSSEFLRSVNMCLKGEILSNEVLEGFNPQTIDLDPPEFQKPDFHILKMLLAAGAEVGGTDKFTPDLGLQSIMRNYIREYLKKIHPRRNLYFSVKKLKLPEKIQSYLLFNTLSEKKLKPDISEDVRNFFSQASRGNREMIQNTIRNGIDVNVKDENGMTLLMVAAQNGHLELCEMLIGSGADVNISNSVTGDTSLIYATEAGQTTCVSKLSEFHVNLNIQGKNGDTALINAARNGNEDCLRVLIDKGVNLNIQNNNGNTALIAAVHRFQFQCAVQLIRAGADVNLIDNQGNTAIVLAARKGQVDFAQKLIAAGADLNHFDEHLRMTALMTAASQGHVKCVNLLIQSGADLNIPDVTGKAALMKTAELVSSETCFSSLLKSGAEIQMAILVHTASRLLQKGGKRGK